MLFFIESNKALSNSNEKLLQIVKDRGEIASYLISQLSKITSLEHTSHFKLIKVPSSNRVNGLLIDKTIPLSLYNSLLIVPDTDAKFELNGVLLKKITNENYNVSLATLTGKKILFDSAKELSSDEKVFGKKNTRDKSIIILLKSPAFMTSEISKLLFTKKS